MNLELNDEQEAIRSTARELLERRLPSERLRTLIDERKNDGVPRVHVRCSMLPPASAINGWPDAFWHMRQ